jgi:hypothetical protein
VIGRRPNTVGGRYGGPDTSGPDGLKRQRREDPYHRYPGCRGTVDGGWCNVCGHHQVGTEDES